MTAFWLDTLASFVADFRLESLKPATVEQTSYVMLDTIGAIAGGAAEPEMQALTAKLAVSPAGEASVIGTDKKAVSAAAAFLNGTAGTFLEMDEGNRFAKGHPAIHALPAVWALAEIKGLSGKAVMEALILGYEIGARIGIAAALRPDMHPHGTWGTVGAATAVAKLLGYDAARIRETINVASSLTLATSKRTMLEGGTVRNAYAGISNRMALMAIDLIEAGFVGERDGLSSVFGRVVSETFDTAKMIDGLGHDWQIDHNYFKLHSCCRYNHGALDALDLLLARESVAADAVERVDVASYLYAAELDDQAPRNTLGAKFSVPFAVATRLARGSSAVENFTWDALRDERVQALAKRVFVVEDKAMTSRLPQVRPAKVDLRLRDGRTFSAAVEANRGDDQDPYSREELTTKYFSLTARVWPHETADNVRQKALTLADVEDIRTVLQQ
ncbi:MmgE/PrpD family protein [Reyranella sp.]|uniref:MmgE/PrpD family protein n=1 Tax=Reyranella sp. TaxID=1929291 RepID=UPI00120002C9|nr:MmgE/PrpD family protein [Reyranella sp.]TAJ86713.1 MAG: MmgE/PrpD family protein [Reyranella sp.]